MDINGLKNSQFYEEVRALAFWRLLDRTDFLLSVAAIGALGALTSFFVSDRFDAVPITFLMLAVVSLLWLNTAKATRITRLAELDRANRILPQLRPLLERHVPEEARAIDWQLLNRAYEQGASLSYETGRVYVPALVAVSALIRKLDRLAGAQEKASKSMKSRDANTLDRLSDETIWKTISDIHTMELTKIIQRVYRMPTEIRFRLQRAGYAESLKTTRTVKTLSEIRATLSDHGITPSGVIVFELIDHRRDDRWETHYVTLNGRAVGYSDGVLPE